MGANYVKKKIRLVYMFCAIFVVPLFPVLCCFFVFSDKASEILTGLLFTVKVKLNYKSQANIRVFV